MAALQVGMLQQIIIADISESLIPLIYLKIIQRDGEDKIEEGCLSLPGIEVEIASNYTTLVLEINSE